MRAVVRTRYGSSDRIEVIDTETPVPGPSQVLVRVAAASLNASDLHELTGSPYLLRTSTGLITPRDPRLGVDLAGTVQAVGAAVRSVRPGDIVLGQSKRTFADEVLTSEEALAHIDPSIPLTLAAAAPLAGSTALQALRRTGLAPGARVLIIGARGGVGSLAVQLARTFGADEVVAASHRDGPPVRGADQTVQTGALPSTGTFDAILDASGAIPARTVARMLRPGGAATVVGLAPNAGAVVGPITSIVAARLASRTRRRIGTFIAHRSTDDLVLLARLLSERTLVPTIDSELPLADAGEAFARFENGRVEGKLVLVS